MPLHTVAPLLTTRRLPDTWLPIAREERLVQSEPGPVTSTSLLLALPESPTVPLSQRTNPPAAIINRLLEPRKPTVRLSALLQTEPLPVTSARLLLPVAL